MLKINILTLIRCVLFKNSEHAPISPPFRWNYLISIEDNKNEKA